MDVRRRIQIGGIKKVTSGGDDVIPEPIINVDNYLTIEALEDGLTASLFVNACEYCVDGDGNWKTLATGTATQSINTRQTLSFRGELTPNSSNGIGTFTISKKCNLKGNCMSMLFGDNAADNYSLSGKNSAFRKLFYNCTNIINVSSNFLPATTLAVYCYSKMFQGCTNLAISPKLPATVLEVSCYNSMFMVCTSLTTAPDLPATTLAGYCYSYMFYNCNSLTTAPDLPATTLAYGCYNSTFNYCTSLTTAPTILPATTLTESCYEEMFNECYSLTTAPELPATTLARNCYSNMFRNCTSLTTAPELPATTLAEYCYSYMFSSCTKLNYIKMLATNISASNCLYNWVKGVASSGTFIKNPAMTTLPTATSSNTYIGIPSGWTVVNDEEESGSNLITFTINNTEYQAEEGMTWEEWVNSEYSRSNTTFVYTITNNIVYEHLLTSSGIASLVKYASNNIPVLTNDVIQKSIKYRTDASDGAD